MKKNITTKYFMSVYIGDTFVAQRLEIPASKYKELFEENNQIAIANECTEEPNSVGSYRFCTTVERDNYIDYITTYRNGCSDLELIKAVCKDGFRFLTKQEVKNRKRG